MVAKSGPASNGHLPINPKWEQLKDAAVLARAGVTYWQVITRTKRALAKGIRLEKQYGTWFIHRDDVKKLKALAKELQDTSTGARRKRGNGT